MSSNYVIKSLGENYNRATFICGNDKLDQYFHNKVESDIARRLAKVYVLHERESLEILGFYTLNAYALDISKLPAKRTRGIHYDDVPAAKIGRLAVHRDYHHQGIGTFLLVDAVTRSMDSDLAIWTLVVDAIDDDARVFYEHFGFQRIIDDEYQLFLPSAVIKRVRDDER